MTPEEIETTLAELRQRMESGRFFAVAYNSTLGTEEDEMKTVCQPRSTHLLEAAAELMRAHRNSSQTSPLFTALKTCDIFHQLTR